ncbi:MAG TPA: hemolysin family protein [Gemmatimonadaceae bacterium]|nr:hemolysin family protein [Gemmatimonadaceae bacterium]
MHGTGDPLSAGDILLRLLAVVVLVAANAFFVAAEFALVGARRSRIDAMAGQNDRRAIAVQQTITHLDRYISATQLGITLASLGLGWVGEATVASVLDRVLRAFGYTIPPAAEHTVAAATTAFLVITFLHIVFGELAPKSMALLNPEGVSRWIVYPLRWFSLLMKPFIAVLNGTANAVLRLAGLRPVEESARVHSPEEIRILVMQTRAHGLLGVTPGEMLAGVFDFHQKRARDVMRPRTEIVALPIDVTREQLWDVLRTERYSRYPVYRTSLDDIVGVFVAKDLWVAGMDGGIPEDFRLEQYVRDALFVPDSRAAERVFDDLRRTRAHLAIVLDEFGGTAGILTMEDLVEEIVGDIADEYDQAIRDALELNGVLELAGSLSLIDVRSDYGILIPEGGWTTLGGYVFSQLGRLPRVGDRVGYPGGELEVVAMDGRRVAAVRVHRAGAPPRAGESGAARGAAH